MGRGIGKIQLRILEVLEELTRRNRRDWFSLLLVVVFLYHQEQVDHEYGSNPSRLGRFVVDWSHTKNEHRRIWESCKMLERRGHIEIRISKENVWGGCTRYMEIKKKI